MYNQSFYNEDSNFGKNGGSKVVHIISAIEIILKKEEGWVTRESPFKDLIKMLLQMICK